VRVAFISAVQDWDVTRRLLNPLLLVGATFLIGTIAFALAGIVDRL
jgi:hypothetical protein